jgi:hypothetical protein
VDGTKARGGQDPLLDDVPISEASTPKTSRQSCSQQHFEMHMPVESGYVGQETGERESDSESDSEAADSVFDSDDGDDVFDSDETDDETDDIEFSAKPPEDSEPAGDSSQSTSDESDQRGSVRKHKALCYEDIILWVVKDPKGGQRDVLAIEIFFRYHKGADNKLKP